MARAHEAFDADRFAEDGQVGFWPGCDAVDKGAADVVYISKEDRWPDLQRRIEASGRVATALGERYQGRVIFSVTPRQP